MAQSQTPFQVLNPHFGDTTVTQVTFSVINNCGVCDRSCVGYLEIYQIFFKGCMWCNIGNEMSMWEFVNGRHDRNVMKGDTNLSAAQFPRKVPNCEA